MAVLVVMMEMLVWIDFLFVWSIIPCNGFVPWSCRRQHQRHLWNKSSKSCCGEAPVGFHPQR
eukprot:3491891-Amphidinium_carterae.1